MFRCKARKKPNREAYMDIEWCGLQRNTADHGALQGMSGFQQPYNFFVFLRLVLRTLPNTGCL